MAFTFHVEAVHCQWLCLGDPAAGLPSSHRLREAQAESLRSLRLTAGPVPQGVGPALPLPVCKALLWVLSFPLCPQWVGAAGCCELTRWSGKGSEVPGTSIQGVLFLFPARVDLVQEPSESEL